MPRYGHLPVHVLQLFKWEFLYFFFLWTLFNTALSAALRFHRVGGYRDRTFDYVYAKTLGKNNLWKTVCSRQAEHQVQTFASYCPAQFGMKNLPKTPVVQYKCSKQLSYFRARLVEIRVRLV
jgi:hypothetical protein